MCVLVVFVWHGYGFRFLQVQSDSMSPRLHKGDIVFIQNVTLYDAAVGDILTYEKNDGSRVLVTHRVVAKDLMQGTITMRGDTNISEDSPVDGGQVIGKFVTVVPIAGYLMQAVHSWWGLAVFVYVPVFILVVRELLRLARHYSRPTYRYTGRAQ